MATSPDTFPDLNPALAERPLTIDWTKDIETGEAIDTFDWSYEGPDNTLTLDRTSKSGNKTSAWVKGGTLGAQYIITAWAKTDSVPPKTLVSRKYLNIRNSPH